MKFCTRHDSVTVMTCAKFHCDQFSIFYIRQGCHAVGNSGKVREFDIEFSRPGNGQEFIKTLLRSGDGREFSDDENFRFMTTPSCKQCRVPACLDNGNQSILRMSSGSLLT